MKKTKLSLVGIGILAGVFTLSGCTANFCTVDDQAHIAYALDYGVTDYVNETGTAKKAYAYVDGVKVEFPNVSYSTAIEGFNSTIESILTTTSNSNITSPKLLWWETLDAVTLGHALKAANFTDYSTLTADLIRTSFDSETNRGGILDQYGYLKYGDSVNEKQVLFTNFESYVQEVRDILGAQGEIGSCANTDFVSAYTTSLKTSLSSYRACLTTEAGEYGSYGPQKISVQITEKKWKTWKGLFEFLLVWPIGAFIQVMTKGFMNAGMSSGGASVLAIFIITILIRGLLLLATFKSTKSQGKMQNLQGDIAKIQAKYPNANSNRYEKERMAMEMAALYKKNGVKPLGSLLTLIIQFPVFICVWGALQSSAVLSNGSFLGLSLSSSIGSTIMNKANWTLSGGAPTALILFLLMAAAQTVSMLLPQILQKKQTKNVAKLGKNPTQNNQQKQTKTFTYVMLIMVVIMGFSLVSAMGVYWLVGALFSIAQTLIINKSNNRKKVK